MFEVTIGSIVMQMRNYVICTFAANKFWSLGSRTQVYSQAILFWLYASQPIIFQYIKYKQTILSKRRIWSLDYTLWYNLSLLLLIKQQIVWSLHVYAHLEVRLNILPCAQSITLFIHISKMQWCSGSSKHKAI